MALLEANNFYGLKSSQVEIMKQENVPALINNSAKLTLNSEGLI